MRSRLCAGQLHNVDILAINQESISLEAWVDESLCWNCHPYAFLLKMVADSSPTSQCTYYNSAFRKWLLYSTSHVPKKPPNHKRSTIYLKSQENFFALPQDMPVERWTVRPSRLNFFSSQKISWPHLCMVHPVLWRAHYRRFSQCIGLRRGAIWPFYTSIVCWLTVCVVRPVLK